MMKKDFQKLMILICLLFLVGCQSESSQSQVSRALGIDASKGSAISSSDTHGGFHGDGTTCIVLRFSDETYLNEIKKSSLWQALPLSGNLTALVYGITSETSSIGPFLTDEEGEPLIPIIENGYYYFMDQHSESTNSQDDSDLLNRYSFNLTIALYDSDTNRLYYLKFDT